MQRLSNEQDDKFTTAAANCADFSIKIEFDHWTDSCGLSYLGILANLDDIRHIIRFKDASIDRHGSNAFLTSVLSCIKTIPSNKINAVISDSASTNIAAETKICCTSSYGHIIPERCMAHFINRVGEGITGTEAWQSLINTGRELVKLTSSSRISAHMHARKTNKLVKPTCTRWYSTVDLFESILVAADPLCALADELGLTRISSVLMREGCISGFVRGTQIMRPVANCKAIAEKAGGTLEETVFGLSEFAKFIFSQDRRDKFILTSIKALLAYFNRMKLNDEFFLLLSAYYLERRFKMDYITRYASTQIFL